MGKLTPTQINELQDIISFAQASKNVKSSYIEYILKLGKTEVEQANNVAVGIIAKDLKNFIKKYGREDYSSMDKNNAIFSVKTNSGNTEEFDCTVHIEGDTNIILICLNEGLKQLHRKGMPKSVLREVLEVACKESEEEED